MKTKYYVLITAIAIYNTLAIACPTCVGRVTKKSAPFFSDECYRSHKSKEVQANHDKPQLDQKTTATAQLKNQGE